MNMLNSKCKTSFAKPEFLKKAQRVNPRLYDIEEMVVDLRYFNSLELEVDSLRSQQETQKTKFLNEIDRLSREYYYADHMNAILGVYTELDEDKNDKSFKENQSKEFRKEREQYFKIQDLKAQLQDKGIAIDRVMLNNSQGKKQEVEDHRRNVKFSKNKTSVTACNDSLNANTSDVNFVCVTYGKCVLNKKHDMCVLNCKLVEMILLIVDPGCSKHMTGNLKLLINFVKKFLCTVKFGNDQIAPMIGYGDLVQGAVTIKGFTTDGENLDKIKEKGDACIFVGYSTKSRAYRVFNKRTRVIVESIRVNFDELPHMASDHASSDPVPQSETLTTSNELDLLFSLMFDKLLNGPTQVVSKSFAVTTADAPNKCQQQHTTPLNTQTTPEPTCQVPTQALTVTSNENINQAETIIENAQGEDDEFINIFCTSVQDRGETSSCYVNSSNMHTFYQRHPSEHRWTKDHPLGQVIGNPSQSVRTRRQLESDGEMCMFALTVSRTKSKNIKESMADSAWIESMQEELHQFDRIDVWELVDRPLCKNVINMKWLWKNKHDEENTAIRNKSRLVAKGYAQKEGVDFEESLAPVARLEAEEVHVNQPDGFVDPYHLEKVYRLKKALYRLKQAPRACKFEMSMNQSPRGIFINQAKYAQEILIKHAKPTEKHLTTVKRVFRYLKDTINKGLWYPKDIGFELTAFSYSDHAGCLDSRKSTSGGIQFLGGDKLVSWSSKKQDCTSMSSAEAEYVSLSACCAQVLWLRTQLTDYGFHFDKIPMYCDSKASIAISCNQVQHSRTKHIDVRYHFIKEKVEKGIVELFFVGTEYQLADLFTKALPEDRFKYLVRRLSMRCLTPEELEMDVKTAFLYGPLKEEGYANQPDGFVNPYHPDKVYRLKKALYGLKQAPRAWGNILLVQIYVDDIIFGSTNPKLSKNLKINARPDIVHETCYCARYQAKPTEKHLTVVKRIFWYLKDTTNMGLWYPKVTGFDLIAFSDSDHAGCLDLRKSTSGGIQFLGGDKLVSWSSKKQDCTLMSSAEAEYVSLSACCAQVLWMRTQLTDYGFYFDKIPMYCNSKATIAISCNPVQHSHTKHINVRHHFIKEKVEKGIIELFFVGTEYQLADLFTKALPEERFKYLVRQLGYVMSTNTQEIGWSIKPKMDINTIITGVVLCKQKIAIPTWYGHVEPVVKNTIEKNFDPVISRINLGLHMFLKRLNEEMVDDLRYFNSLESEVDSLTSQLDTQKTQFMNEIDRLSREYFYADHINAILGVYTELDEVTNLQCDYLELMQKCECLETELSKSKQMSKSFESVQKHAINLELELQQCKEKVKNDMSTLSHKKQQFIIKMDKGKDLVVLSSDTDEDMNEASSVASVPKEGPLIRKRPYVRPELVKNGNSKKSLGRDSKRGIIILFPVSFKEHVAVQREIKERTLLLQSLPEDHMADFHHLDDAREIWLAVKARFGGNEESKKMRKTMLKQEFSEFSVSKKEGLHKGYDRALPPSWSQVALTLKTRGGLEYLSFDDLYNKLRSLEIDVKGGSSYGSRGGSNRNGRIRHQMADGYALSKDQQMGHFARECNVKKVDEKARYSAFKISEVKTEDPKAMVSVDSMLNWNEHEAENKTEESEQVYGLMAGFKSDFVDHSGNAAGSVYDVAAEFAMMGIYPKVQTCPFGCDSKLSKLNKNYDHLEKLYNDSFIQVQAYKNTIKTLELQKDWYHKTQLALEEKFRILSANLENTTNTLKYSETLYDQAKIKKKEWEVKLVESLVRFDKWKKSSKNLAKLINSSMSTRTKLGLGFKEYIGSDEVFDLSTPSVFDHELENREVKSLYERFVKAGETHEAPPSMTGTFMPTSYKSDLEETRVTFGSKSNTSLINTSESNNFVSCDNSDKSSESETYDFASCVSSPKTNDSFSTVDVKILPKSDVKDPSPTNGFPSCSFKENVKPPRNLCNKSGIADRIHCKNNFVRTKTCFFCGSKSHLIMDCDVYDNVDNFPSVVSKASSVPASSRNSSASISAGRSIPAASRNRPASIHAGRHILAGRFNKPAPFPAGRSVPTDYHWNQMDFEEQKGCQRYCGHKARLVAQGHRQDEGIDYDEVFAPVARIEAIRLFLAFASYMGFMVYQMDVKSAFLYGEIEEEVDSPFQLEAYSDSDYDGSHRDRKSITGRYQFMGRSFVWTSSSTKGLVCQIVYLSVKASLQKSQDKYVKDMLKKFDMESKRTATTPYEVLKPKSKDEPDDVVNVHLYISMISSLMYLTASRPDIMFALEAYSDSDYAGSHGDRKSTTSGCQFLGRRLISWQCKKQTIVATSSTEAEYVAAASCCGQSTICIVKNLVFHQRTKHIEIRHHFIRDANEKNLIQSTLGCSIPRPPMLLVVQVFLLVVLVYADGSVPAGSCTIPTGSYSFMRLDWDGPHMPLLAPMLVVPAGGDGADTAAAGAAAVTKVPPPLPPPVTPPPDVPPIHASSSTPGPSTAAQDTPVRDPTPVREPTPSPVREPTTFREPTPEPPRPSPPPCPTRQTSFIEDISEDGGGYVSSPKSNEASPTTAATAAGGAEDSVALTDLSLKLDRCINRVTTLENELGVTKKVLSGAVLKLVSRVKRLEGILKHRKRSMVLSDSEGEEAATKEPKIDLDALHELASTSLGGDITVEAAYTIFKASQDAHASSDAGPDEDEVPDTTTMPFRRTRTKRRRLRKTFTSSTFEHFQKNISAIEDTIPAGDGIPVDAQTILAASTPIPTTGHQTLR
nr:copia protein [Tanacetum cinerariifolium]